MKTWTKIILACLILFSFFKCSFQKRLHRKGYYIEWLTHHSSKQKNDFKSSEIISPKPIQAFKSSHHDDVSLNSSLQASTSNHSNIIRSIKSFLSQTQPDTCGDILTLKNGDEYVVKVLEITEKEIKYKRCDNINGPVYSISKSKIYIIRYANGVSEHIETTEPDKKLKQSATTNSTTDNKNKTHPPGYTLSWVLFSLSLFSYFVGFTGLALFFLMFTARNAKRRIKEHPELYKGLPEMNFLMHYSFIITSLLALLLLILGIIFLSNPARLGLTVTIASFMGFLLILIGLIVALPVIVFLLTSNKDDFS